MSELVRTVAVASELGPVDARPVDARPGDPRLADPHPGDPRPGAGFTPPAPRPLRLRHILFLLLLLPGIIPLLISSFHLIGENKEILKTQQTELLTHFAQGFAQLLSDDLARHKLQLQQLGRGLVAAPGFGSLEERLRAEWAIAYLRKFAFDHRHEQIAFHVVDQRGSGLRTGAEEGLDETVEAAMSDAFNQARESGQPVYRFAVLPGGLKPAVAIAVPIPTPDASDLLIVQALVHLPLHSASLDINEMFLVDAQGQLLWSRGSQPQIEQALLQSDLVRDFVSAPIAVTSESQLEAEGERYSILARVVPVRETGWGVVAHKSTAVAFQQVEEMVKGVAISSLVAVLLAFFFAWLATGWLSRPIQRLAETSHEIAAGHFDRRVPTTGLTLEVVELAEDFNRMSAYVENYVEQLRRAAEANRQLFISSIRAFAAAIDAKDPYTRGHSERVARYSRAIAHYLGLPKDVQEKVWISAVLHDVGKIGVEDQVLRKVGRLTEDEFDQMKQHPAIGADIVEPISPLREMLPGIRWHHEAWNGSGYPDGLRGEQIPLMARVIGVADTFDAITTNRPYQQASKPEYALQIIKKLTGTKFDAKIVTAFLLAWEAGHIKMDPDESSARIQAPPVPKAVAQ